MNSLGGFLPLNFRSSGLSSNSSSWLGPPAMKRKMTALALGEWGNLRAGAGGLHGGGGGAAGPGWERAGRARRGGGGEGGGGGGGGGVGGWAGGGGGGEAAGGGGVAREEAAERHGADAGPAALEELSAGDA